MYLVYPLVAHPQSAELVQPCRGSLDNPPVYARPGAPFGDHWCDVARTQRFPRLKGIVSPVRIQPLRSATRTTAFAPYRRYRIHQWQHLSHVVTVGSGQNCRQRSPIGVGDHLMLTPRLPAIRRIGARFSPRLQPPGPTHCPHRHGTSPYRQPLAVWTTGVHGDSATLRLHAILSDGASRSSPIHIPYLYAATNGLERI